MLVVCHIYNMVDMSIWIKNIIIMIMFVLIHSYSCLVAVGYRKILDFFDKIS